MATGGALFGSNNSATLRDVYNQYQTGARQDKQLQIVENRRLEKEEKTSQYLTNKFWDPKQIALAGSGDAKTDPMINQYMAGRQQEYLKMIKSGMTYNELAAAMQQDFVPVSNYMKQTKEVNAGLEKYATTLQKEGVNPTQFRDLVKERMYTTNGQPKDFKTMNLDLEDAVKETLASDIDRLDIDENKAFKPLTTRQKTTVAGEIYNSNTPDVGLITKTRVKGAARFDPGLYDVDYEKQTDPNAPPVAKDIRPKTRDFKTADGQLYKDPTSGKTAEPVLADDAFDIVYTNNSASAKAAIDKYARIEAKKLEAKGKTVTDDDMDYFRREKALQVVENNSGTEFRGVDSRTYAIRRAPRPREAKEAEVIDRTIASPGTKPGFVSVSGMSVQPDVGRSGPRNQPMKAEVEQSLDGKTLRIIARPVNEQGIVYGDPIISEHTGQDAINKLKSIRMYPGNKKGVDILIKDVEKSMKPAAGEKPRVDKKTGNAITPIQFKKK